MDRSAADLLSEIVHRVVEELGPRTRTDGIASEFSDIGPKNPLNRLSRRDKLRLIALIALYEHIKEAERVFSQKEEEAARFLADAGKLANRLQAERAGGPFSGMELFERLAKDLQPRLSSFTELGKILDSVGKRGHKHKTLLNCILISASEFIQIKTGTYNDEHFAELLQGRSDTQSFKEFSGDAIRKKREHFQKIYPDFYKTSQKMAYGLSSQESIE